MPAQPESYHHPADCRYLHVGVTDMFLARDLCVYISCLVAFCRVFAVFARTAEPMPYAKISTASSSFFFFF